MKDDETFTFSHFTDNGIVLGLEDRPYEGMKPSCLIFSTLNNNGETEIVTMDLEGVEVSRRAVIKRGDVIEKSGNVTHVRFKD